MLTQSVPPCKADLAKFWSADKAKLTSYQKTFITEQPLVLAIDSNLDNLWLVTEVLSQCGCWVITATEGETALQIAEEHQPDLILVELVLPRLDGINLVRYLRQKAYTVPIIAVTSLLSSEYQERAVLAGCNEYIEKPYQISELEAAIARCYQNTERASGQLKGLSLRLNPL